MIVDSDEQIIKRIDNPLNDDIIKHLGWERLQIESSSYNLSTDSTSTILYGHKQFGGRSGTITNKHIVFVYLKRIFRLTANQFIYKLYVITWSGNNRVKEKDEDSYHEEQYDVRTVFELIEQCNVLITKIQDMG